MDPIRTLRDMGFGSLGSQVLQKALDEHKGDVEMTIDALLSGWTYKPPASKGKGAKKKAQKPAKPVTNLQPFPKAATEISEVTVEVVHSPSPRAAEDIPVDMSEEERSILQCQSATELAFLWIELGSSYSPSSAVVGLSRLSVLCNRNRRTDEEILLAARSMGDQISKTLDELSPSQAASAFHSLTKLGFKPQVLPDGLLMVELVIRLSDEDNRFSPSDLVDIFWSLQKCGMKDDTEFILFLCKQGISQLDSFFQLPQTVVDALCILAKLITRVRGEVLTKASELAAKLGTIAVEQCQSRMLFTEREQELLQSLESLGLQSDRMKIEKYLAQRASGQSEEPWDETLDPLLHSIEKQEFLLPQDTAAQLGQIVKGRGILQKSRADMRRRAALSIHRAEIGMLAEEENRVGDLSWSAQSLWAVAELGILFPSQDYVHELLFLSIENAPLFQPTDLALSLIAVVVLEQRLFNGWVLIREKEHVCIVQQILLDVISNAVDLAEGLDFIDSKLPSIGIVPSCVLPDIFDPAALSFDTGFVFKASGKTYDECLSKGLFGLPRNQWDKVRHVKPQTTALFLFNGTTHQIEGIFVATEMPGLDLDPHAWTTSLSSPSKTENERLEDKSKLFVAPLPLDATNQQLFPIFQAYGFVESIFIVRDKLTQMSKGCAFIKYRTVDEAADAIQGLAGTYPFEGMDRPVQLRIAEPRSSGIGSNLGSGSGPTPYPAQVFVRKVTTWAPVPLAVVETLLTWHPDGSFSLPLDAKTTRLMIARLVAAQPGIPGVPSERAGGAQAGVRPARSTTTESAGPSAGSKTMSAVAAAAFEFARVWDSSPKGSLLAEAIDRLWQAGLGQAVEAAKRLDVQQVTLILWSLARRRENLQVARAAAASSASGAGSNSGSSDHTLASGGIQSIAGGPGSSAAAFGSAGSGPDPVERRLEVLLVDRLLLTIEGFDAGRLAAVLWALATLDHSPDRRFLSAIEAQALLRVETFTPRETADTLWALARMTGGASGGGSAGADGPPANLIARLIEAAAERAPRIPPAGVARVLWALHRLRRPLTGLTERLVLALCDRAAAAAAEFEVPQDAAGLLWALAKLLRGEAAPEGIRAVAARACDLAPRMDDSTAKAAHWALDALGFHSEATRLYTLFSSAHQAPAATATAAGAAQPHAPSATASRVGGGYRSAAAERTQQDLRPHESGPRSGLKAAAGGWSSGKHIRAANRPTPDSSWTLLQRPGAKYAIGENAGGTGEDGGASIVSKGGILTLNPDCPEFTPSWAGSSFEFMDDFDSEESADPGHWMPAPASSWPGASVDDISETSFLVPMP